MTETKLKWMTIRTDSEVVGWLHELSQGLAGEIGKVPIDRLTKLAVKDFRDAVISGKRQIGGLTFAPEQNPPRLTRSKEVAQK